MAKTFNWLLSKNAIGIGIINTRKALVIFTRVLISVTPLTARKRLKYTGPLTYGINLRLGGPGVL